MKISSCKCTPLLVVVAFGGAAALPLAATDAAEVPPDGSRPVLATDQPALLGLGPNSGDALRALMQEGPEAFMAPAHGDTIHDSFASSVLAREAPAPAGTGPNSSDLARANLQDDQAAFALLGTRSPVLGSAGNVATVDSNNVELHGRGGWNPALVQLQTGPHPLPWETRVADAVPARTTSESGR